MFVVGIDPSFTRTGLCFADGSALVYSSVSASQTGIYDYSILLPEAQNLSFKIVESIKENCKQFNKLCPDIIIQEYPVFGTRPGGVLAVLMTNLYREIKSNFPSTEYYMVPAVAVRSFTKTKSKTELVNWVKEKTNQPKVNHDKSTAYVLAVIGARIKKGNYNKSYIKF